MPDFRVLNALASEIGVELGLTDVTAIRRELSQLARTQAVRLAGPRMEARGAARPGEGTAVLATWHHLIDLGSLLDGDHILAGTARPSVVRMSKATAAALGEIADGDLVSVGTERGALQLPAALTDMPDGVVWVPTNAPGVTVRRTLGVTSGAVVTVTRVVGSA
jgi:NADH-quinone oxidoreductase subunit G